MTKAWVSQDLIDILSDITKILREQEKKPTKKMVCAVLVHQIKFRSTILQNIKNDK